MRSISILSFVFLLFPLDNFVHAQINNPFASIDPKAAQAEITKAERIYEEGYYEESLEVLEKIQSNDAQITKQINLLRGKLFNKKEQYEKAFSIFDELTRNHPRDPDAWLGFGDFLYQQTRYPAAAQAYQKVLEFTPEAVIPAYKRFICQLVTEDPESVEIPDIFTRYTPNHPGYHLAHAAKFFAQGEQDRAMYFLTGATHMFSARDNLILLTPLFQTGWIHPQEVNLFTLGAAHPRGE